MCKNRVGRRIKVLPSESPYFELIPHAKQAGKVAPGMELVYTVRFSPDGFRDYADEIVCITEREKFVIPVRAVGARAVLDFPDSVSFPTAPVKHKASKVLLIRNVGAAAASFAVASDAPFELAWSRQSARKSSKDIGLEPPKPTIRSETLLESATLCKITL